MTTDAKEILLTFVVLSKFARKIFFFLEIFRPIRIREKWNSFIWFFCSFDTRDQWTLMLKKFYWPFLYCRNPREKFIFSSKFFDQSEFEIKWNSIVALFLHSNRRTSGHWCWINTINLCCMVEIRVKNYFFSSKFFHQSEFEKK